MSLSIALLGAGQLGGSFALALRTADPSITIIAYDPTLANAEQLVSMGGANAVAKTVAEAVKNADIVILAAPVRAFRSLAEAMAPYVKSQAIITDVGSVKRSMVPLVELLPNARVIPGHPIAGSEKAGVAVARGDLFKNKLVILTPFENSDPAAIEAIETLWHLAGADVLSMPVDVHDQIYAYVSHLPHLISFVAASYLFSLGIRVDEGHSVLERFLRISRSNPRMWTDIFLENREALLPALAVYRSILAHFASELRAGEPKKGDSVALSKTHLPRILAASLISSVSLYEQQSGLELKPFGAGGLRDIAAPAADEPEAAMQAISDAAAPMADAIEGIIPRFEEIERLIGAEDEKALFALVTAMAKDGEVLNARRQ